jgi:hypothetical protein
MQYLCNEQTIKDAQALRYGSEDRKWCCKTNFPLFLCCLGPQTQMSSDLAGGVGVNGVGLVILVLLSWRYLRWGGGVDTDGITVVNAA